MPLHVIHAKPNMENVLTFDRPDANIRVTECDHRVANSLAVVSGLLRLQASKLAGSTAKLSAADVAEQLAKAAARIEVVAQMHRRMAHEGADGDVDLAELVRRVAEDTVTALSQPGRTRLSLAIDDTCLAPQRIALPVGLIVGELVTNSLRHAHPTGVAGAIEVSCRGGGGEEIHIEVADDGVGLPESFDPRRAQTLGLKLVRAFAKQAGGRLSFTDHAIGLSVRLTVPPRAR
jgi:two-component sensor histidine kinase